MKFQSIYFSAAGLTQTLASPLSGRICRGHEALKDFVIPMKLLLIFLSAAGLTQTLASPLSGRIFLGHEALKGMFSSHVLIYVKGADYIEQCSGALIGSFWIVTAAHCIEDFKETSIEVHLGNVQFGNGETVREVPANNVYIHENYNHRTLANDIALLKVDEIIFSDKIKPVDLPKINGIAENLYVNHSALASGWGSKGNNRSIADVLRFTVVRVVSSKICKETYSGPNEFRSSEICVDTSLAGSPCNGDSGGPLVEIPSNVLIGILSSTYAEDCESGRPIIYTRITYYRNWIKIMTGI